ncbi:MAG: glycerol-3-phosphate dehydrogenase/oxidase [Bacteroidota bacterium]
MRVALVDKGDFASGTSSKSTKLIHGGLRYLKQLELKLVMETGRERAIAFKNASYLVRPEKMLLPFVKGGTFGRKSVSFALWVYDILAGVEKADRRTMLGLSETLEKEPLLRKENVLGGGYYAEYRTDDARLVMAIAKTAEESGAALLNYVRCKSFEYTNEKISGAMLVDECTKKSFTLKAKFVVNATGPWVDKLRKKDKSREGKRLQPTKGIHVVFSKEKFPLSQAVYFDVSDGRMIFAIPRGRAVYAGTTDTLYEHSLNKVYASKEDAEYILNGINAMFNIALSLEDIESSWAGLRPLIYEKGKTPGELSRKDEIFFSKSGLISIAGGKLTGYRLMAKKITKIICKRLGILTACKTRKKALYGSISKSESNIEQLGKRLELSEDAITYLIQNYGCHATEVLNSINQVEGTSIDERLVKAECWFTCENEYCLTLIDFFNRRTGRLYFNMPSVQKYKIAIAHLMQKLHEWSDEERAEQLNLLDLEIARLSNFSY